MFYESGERSGTFAVSEGRSIRRTEALQGGEVEYEEGESRHNTV